KFYLYGSLVSVHVFYVLYFFFSSRRRHTRSKRDWSSDVCSSDLSALVVPMPSKVVNSSSVAVLILILIFASLVLGSCSSRFELRSEERRVGKECRCRWWTDH